MTGAVQQFVSSEFLAKKKYIFLIFVSLNEMKDLGAVNVEGSDGSAKNCLLCKLKFFENLRSLNKEASNNNNLPTIDMSTAASNSYNNKITGQDCTPCKMTGGIIALSAGYFSISKAVQLQKAVTSGPPRKKAVALGVTGIGKRDQGACALQKPDVILTSHKLYVFNSIYYSLCFCWFISSACIIQTNRLGMDKVTALLSSFEKNLP
ncbi:hypothetical protein BDF20DRAFT_836190 [Mycotypha africana]|uniref:uncharacterized protein n=1 Tax=Mycotypha africana TaxID=64632 RepID=UPI0023016E28|nr:uncharacterized protein BDF20DRAFT_836190 [Mycotypha africana]KAI8977378.1 hypothetical protein BDF20DRAFT_836190 [Mycotypha africana]